MSLLKLGRQFDVVVLYSDARLAAVMGGLLWIAGARCRVVLQEMYFNPAAARDAHGTLAMVRCLIARLMYSLVVHTASLVVVHTSTEVRALSTEFRVPDSRFRFIPYYCYPDAEKYECDGDGSAVAGTRILAPGRHRDYRCFASAVSHMPWDAAIVAGASDMDEILEPVPPNLHIYCEVSFARYREMMANADVVVIPLHQHRFQRSLGQIAFLEATMMGKAVVAARTFQLADYAEDLQEVLYYRPGDAGDLRDKIELLIRDPSYRRRLARAAQLRVRKDFTIGRYVSELLRACQDVCDSRRVSLDH